MKDKRAEISRYGKGFLEQQGKMLILHVKGEPYERGYQHGYLLREVINETVPKCLTAAAAVIAKAINGSVDDGFKKMQNGLDQCKGYIPPELLEEQRGLADALSAGGSPLDFNDILVWNTMYDSWCFFAHEDVGDPSSEFYRAPYPHTIGCSSFSAWGNATLDGKLIFGKNMDNLTLPGVENGRVVIFCDPDNGFGHVNVTQAGMLAIDGGFNEAGISMMTHYSGSEYETMRGCGIGTLSRLILQKASNVNDAIDILTVHPRCTGINYHVTDAKVNKAVVVETNAKEVAVRRPFQKDLMWSTNHYNCYPGWMGYEGPNMVTSQQKIYQLKDISTLESWQAGIQDRSNGYVCGSERFLMYDKLLNEAYGNITFNKAIQILTDRHNPATGKERDWDFKASTWNNGVTISFSAKGATYAEKARFYKSNEEGKIEADVTNLWSMISTPINGDLLVATEGYPAHRTGYRAFNLLEELGR